MMSKGLKSLRKIEKKLSNCYGQDIAYDKETFDLFSDVGHELQALELIKKYNVRPSDFHYHTSYEVYQCNMSFADDDEIMNEEEYNLLKEVLL